MSVLGKIIKKSWVGAAAAVLVLGSTTIMAFAMNNTIPENAALTGTANVRAVSFADTAKTETAASKPAYTVVDRSKMAVDTDALKDELSHKAGMTPEKVEALYKDIIANMTPGEKDMSADQAAALCAAIVQKAYGVDLTGYTADTTFSKNPLPYTDNWGVIFHVPGETDASVRYYASVNSVSGALLNAGCYDLSYRETKSENLSNPDWISTGERDIAALLPSGVSITGSKVVSATELSGVTVVCRLSDGSDWAVRMTGDAKSAEVYIAFPNGYDGSLDYKPVTDGGVG